LGFDADALRFFCNPAIELQKATRIRVIHLIVGKLLLLRKEIVSSNSVATLASITTGDGTLFIIYDHQRHTLDRAGKPVTDDVHLHQVLTQIQDTDDTLGAPGKRRPN